MKKPSEVLKAVRKRLEPKDDEGNPATLSRYYGAENKEGKPALPLGKDAVRWDLIGAVYATGMPREWDHSGAIDYLRRSIVSSLAIFVQEATHDTILDRIDDAIRWAEADGK